MKAKVTETDDFIIKTGQTACGWKVCYDKKTGKYTGEVFSCSREGMQDDFYEIDKAVFDVVGTSPDNRKWEEMIASGRHLYMSVNNQYGPPFHAVFDDDFEESTRWTKPVQPKESKGMRFPKDPFETEKTTK